MTIKQSAIKHLIQTGAAVDITNAEISRRPLDSTVIFYSTGQCGLNGIVIRDNATGVLYAVVGRVSNLFILAA